MHFQDDMNGFLTALKGGAHESNPALPAPTAHSAGGTAVGAAPTSLRNPRSLNGFGPPPFPSFSGAISSDRLSAGGGGGPVSRTLSFLRTTGEASLGSFNNVSSLHPMPPSLSADPPLHSSAIPQRSPPSPIPHLHHNAFANNSAYHTFGLSHLNQSPSSVARNTLNYSPQPQPPTSVTVTASHAHPVSAPPRNGMPPHAQAPQRPPHHQMGQPAVSHPQQQPSRQATPVEQQADPSSTQSRPPETSQTQMQQRYGQYAAPQPQTMYKGPAVGPNSIPRQSTAPPQPSHPVRPPEPPTKVNNAPPTTEARAEPKRGRSSQTPSKRARSNGRHSPTTPRSAAGAGGSVPIWGTQNGGSNKSRSGTTGPSNAEGTANGHATSGTEEQSRPERKREREKRRRETMNTRFNELAQCLVISAGGKSDKESILAEAVEHCKKQAATIRDLKRQNRELMSEAMDLRAEKSELRQDKNYLREERDRLKAELDALKVEFQGKKRQKVEHDVKKEEVKRHSSKRNGESGGTRKSEAVTV